MVPQRWVIRVCALKLTSYENLGHQHMGAAYHQGRSQIASTSESHGVWRVGLGARQVRGQGRVIERGEEVTTSPLRPSYPKAKRQLERRWTRRSTTMPQRRICWLQVPCKPIT
ncbi:hypothetical protein B296_00007083 [Ensete ventricosum]|uniref:Uncharacterized protein n=1 Tax=Ensete ventricosum TaxID=4639 RepID=A0A426ZC60_ENSVE|nr:hypothetical protein B296_00007083 [Ensete ventricosum]